MIISIMTTEVSDFYTDLKKSPANISVSIVVVIDPCLKNVMFNDVTVYGKPKKAEFLIRFFGEYQNLFINQDQTVDILEKK